MAETETWAYTHWRGRWFCPVCERIFRKVTTRAEDGTAWHSWRCKEPMRLSDVTITPHPAEQPERDA